ncbi:Uncharacterized protein APZ42_004680, partial [Daphnia magna]
FHGRVRVVLCVCVCVGLFSPPLMAVGCAKSSTTSSRSSIDLSHGFSSTVNGVERTSEAVVLLAATFISFSQKTKNR